MLPPMVVAFGVVTAGIALSNWYAVATGRRRLEWWSKLLTMVGLIAVSLAAGAGSSATGWWLLAALLFGLLGDLALLGHTEGRFVAGVAAFLVGHLAYLVCFANLGLPAPGWSWLGLLVLAVVAFGSREVVPTAYRLSGVKLAVPIAVYSLVIGAMLVVAWLTGLALVAAGATVFVVSDTIIAVTLAKTDFGRPAGRAQLAVMVTYHLGQALIAAGVLSQLG